MSYCPDCGTNVDDSKFCGNCGARQDRNFPQTASAAEPALPIPAQPSAASASPDESTSTAEPKQPRSTGQNSPAPPSAVSADLDAADSTSGMASSSRNDPFSPEFWKRAEVIAGAVGLAVLLVVVIAVTAGGGGGGSGGGDAGSVAQIMDQSIDVNSNLSGGSIDCTNESGSNYSCQVQKTCQDGSPLDESLDVTYTNGEVYDTSTGERFSTFWTELESAAGTC